jgi:hypothetical protein
MMEIILAVLGIVLAAIGVWVMLNQRAIAALQVRLFLLDKRYEFYDCTLRVLFEYMTYGKVRDEEIGWRFFHQRRMAAHLFDDAMKAYADAIVEKIGERAVEVATEAEPIVQGWFAEEYGRAVEVFAPYLKVE